jgi:CRISPR-associated protein Cas1
VKQHLNTLFVQTDGAYLAKDGEAVAVRLDGKVHLRVPIRNLGGIVAFGRVNASTRLLGLCAEHGVAVSFMTSYGRLIARVSGFTSGNVLLRREQYRRTDNEPGALAIASTMVAAKVANSRTVLVRAARDHPTMEVSLRLAGAAKQLLPSIEAARGARSLDELRGVEGEAASRYFSVFSELFTDDAGGFRFAGRVRRPPTDPVNALLSFVYSMLTHDARSACEAVGLDSQVGFLHRDRPGRPSLALDLIEELRPFLADRLMLSLINRRQVRPEGFRILENEAVLMTDETRKCVLTAYQKRKQEVITHPFLDEKTTVGLLVHLQARLLARHLRGDLDAYPPFIWR